VAVGATQPEVIHLLGKPKKIESCGRFLGSLPKDIPTHCANEYVYASPFAPLLPQYYVVRFDDTGRALETANLPSP
jgi:hypothetical protein